jgi:hypothetical protein
VPSQRVLVNRPADLRIALTDQEGVHTAPVGGLTATCTRLDDTTVALGTASVDDFGVVTYPVAASELTAPDVLSLEVTDGGDGSKYTTQIHVAGAHYFTVTEVRDVEKALAANTTKYSGAEIVRARIETEDECERICRQAFVPRARKVVLSGDGTDVLLLDQQTPTKIRSLSIDGVALTTGELADVLVEDAGIVRRVHADWPQGAGNIVLIYEHGWPAPPSDLKRAALQRLRERLNMTMSGIPDRALSLTTDGGTFSIATAGRSGFETGSPDIDAVYARYRNMPLVIA